MHGTDVQAAICSDTHAWYGCACSPSAQASSACCDSKLCACCLGVTLLLGFAAARVLHVVLQLLGCYTWLCSCLGVTPYWSPTCSWLRTSHSSTSSGHPACGQQQSQASFWTPRLKEVLSTPNLSHSISPVVTGAVTQVIIQDSGPQRNTRSSTTTTNSPVLSLGCNYDTCTRVVCPFLVHAAVPSYVPS